MIPSIKKWLNHLAPALLILSFALLGSVSLISIRQLQGDARVINYAGLVRGATQRLIKQEINDVENDELIQYLDTLLEGLEHGGGTYHLVQLKSKEFQAHILEMKMAWAEIKEEILKVREGEDPQWLYALSEDYFHLADTAVSSAEVYSEGKVRNATWWIMALNLILILAVIAFWIYNRIRKSMYTALQAAEHASREKSEFLSRMSHEIRTPMNGIIGMTEIAMMSVHDPEKTMEHLRKISLSSDYLLSLINDILDMSRIESGKFSLSARPFSLEAFRSRLEVMFQQRAEDAGINYTVELVPDVPCALLGDELRLSQVIVNIIANALKFTPEGGRVSASIFQEPSGDDMVNLRFVIEDTGIGMSEEFQTCMFEPFEQEDSSSGRQYGGTGLGLSISYNLVKMMSGTIDIDSKIGRGSCFTVTLSLPRAPEDALTQNEMASIREKNRPKKAVHILLAEDNDINWEITNTLLEAIGHTSERARNGEEAVELFAQAPYGHFDLILMDVQMPVMDGLEASRRIRSGLYPGGETIPIIGLSANAFEQDVQQAMDSGMSAYLPKPFHVHQLDEVMQKLF